MFRDYIEAQGINEPQALISAGHIDVLTYNRIQDFEALTATQQTIIKRVHNRLTKFEEENADILDVPFDSYSINGVSMAFSQNLKLVNGIAIPNDLYMQLLSTGLCYPAI